MRDLVALAKAKVLARVRDAELTIDSGLLPFVEAMVSAAAEVVSGLATFDASTWARRGTSLLVQVLNQASDAAGKCSSTSCSAARCAIELAKQCVEQDSCDAALIADMLAKPQDYGPACQGVTTLGGALGSLRPVFGDLEALLLKAMEVAHNDGIDARKRAALAVELAAELAARLDAVFTQGQAAFKFERLLQAASAAPGKLRYGCSSLPAHKKGLCRRIRAYGQFSRLAAAAIHLDLQNMLLEGTAILVDLLPGDRPAARRFASLITPVLAYLSTYATNRNGSDAAPAERREARKAAVEAFIDAGTDRDNRIGDHIFSLGVSILLQAGWGSTPSEDFQFGTQPLGATVGVAYTWHHLDWSGIQIQASFLDLGSYLRLGDMAEALTPDWDDLLQLGGDIGWSFAAGSVPAYVGLRGAWQPFVRSSDSGGPKDGMFLGFVLGAYVPFFDFN